LRFFLHQHKEGGSSLLDLPQVALAANHLGPKATLYPLSRFRRQRFPISRQCGPVLALLKQGVGRLVLCTPRTFNSLDSVSRYPCFSALPGTQPQLARVVLQDLSRTSDFSPCTIEEDHAIL
jgi:hypothetical protein